MHLREKNIFHLKWRDFGEKWSLEFVAEDTSPKFLTLPAKIVAKMQTFWGRCFLKKMTNQNTLVTINCKEFTLNKISFKFSLRSFWEMTLLDMLVKRLFGLNMWLLIHNLYWLNLATLSTRFSKLQTVKE